MVGNGALRQNDASVISRKLTFNMLAGLSFLQISQQRTLEDWVESFLSQVAWRGG
jgi:hypothetical protein